MSQHPLLPLSRQVILFRSDGGETHTTCYLGSQGHG